MVQRDTRPQVDVHQRVPCNAGRLGEVRLGQARISVLLDSL